MSRMIKEKDAVEVTIKIIYETLYNATPWNYPTAVSKKILADIITKVVVSKFNDIPTAYDADRNHALSNVDKFKEVFGEDFFVLMDPKGSEMKIQIVGDHIFDWWNQEYQPPESVSECKS